MQIAGPKNGGQQERLMVILGPENEGCEKPMGRVIKCPLQNREPDYTTSHHTRPV